MMTRIWDEIRGGKLRRHCCFRLMTAAAVLIAAGASKSAHGQASDIEPRDPAAVGPGGFENEPLWETTLAAGGETIVAVSNAGRRSGIPETHIAYAVARYLPSNDSAVWTWTREAIVPVGQFIRAIDPSIVYDSFAPQGVGEFVLAGLLTDDNDDDHIAVTRYDVAAQSWSDWVSLTGPGGFDKPWIVKGTSTTEVQEFYIVYVGPGGYWYLRTTNDGLKTDDWVGGRMMVGGQQVAGTAPHMPAVYGDGPLYFAYRSLKRIRFVKGEDIDDPNDPNDGGVEFNWLPAAPHIGRGPSPPPSLVPLQFWLNRAEIRDFLPGHERPWYVFGAGTQPMLAVDPTDPDRLFIVYQDTGTDDPNDTDVNIYVRKLARQPSGGWQIDDPIQVNDDDTDFESDQFLPSVTVDESGYTHVIFHDDRRFEQDDELDPKFDVWYAWSDVELLNFEGRNSLLYENDPNDPNDPPALDFTLDVQPVWFELGEYIGIT
jgi:hypothetical protein